MRLPGLRTGVPLLAATLAAGIALGSAWADTSCTFTVTGTGHVPRLGLLDRRPIVIPDGLTLDGAGHSITAFDPLGGHFKGGGVVNGGTTANVEHLTILTHNLANVCDGGADRLRGVMFDGASGTIAHNAILGMNQGPSPCQEGNAIEVRNGPFDGTHRNTQHVRIFNNRIEDYQKTGIVANGDVYAEVVANHLSSSATQPNLAANGIRIGFGGAGAIRNNKSRGYDTPFDGVIGGENKAIPSPHR